MAIPSKKGSIVVYANVFEPFVMYEVWKRLSKEVSRVFRAWNVMDINQTTIDRVMYKMCLDMNVFYASM